MHCPGRLRRGAGRDGRIKHVCVQNWILMDGVVEGHYGVLSVYEGEEGWMGSDGTSGQVLKWVGMRREEGERV